MSKTTRAFLPTIVALVLAGAYPSTFAAGTSAAPSSTSGSGDSSGQTSGASGTAATAVGSSAATADDDKAVQNLLRAAQLLREGTQRLAQMPPGETRTAAIRENNEALMQVHAAIASLPSHLLLADAKEADYKKAMDKMQQASDRLYKAVDALARQPAGKLRNDAIKQVNTALLETNEAMLTGLQLSGMENRSNASRASGSSGSGDSASHDDKDKRGSAEATGRPGANNVELNAPESSGASTTGTTGSGKDSGTSTVGPTGANDIGVMDSPNSLYLREGASSTGGASSTDGQK